jgi:type 1 glutamine amidotransferase
MAMAVASFSNLASLPCPAFEASGGAPESPGRALDPLRTPVARPVRVLILSGLNNHDWKSTTPKLEAILREAGRFAVEITERPDLLTADFLAPFDVILSNWNAYGLDPAASDWPASAKSAYVDFVRAGKGHVVVHAGSASFPGWGEYLSLTLATFKPGQTDHGPRHEFPVRIDAPDHPVTCGLGPFTISDELWNRPEITGRPSVLASSYSSVETQGTGQWEPSVLAGTFGRGRTITTLLGHDAEAMANPGFQALLVRGVEWAATGFVTDSVQEESSAEAWRWEKADGRSLALTGPAGVVWRLLYDSSLDTPYFHPLATVDGRVLTWDRPPDHPWHHGLWFSWKFINKVNYWEIDAATGRRAGRTSWRLPQIEAREDRSARIDLDLSYRPAGEAAPVLTERRTVEVSTPDRDGAYTIDWTCVFTAARSVVLDRTPLLGEPEGQTWGGYAGLSVRLAPDLADPQAVSSDGPVSALADDRYRGRHTAMDYAALVGGQPAGIAVCDHPDNPRAPTPWYVIRSAEMSFFTPAILCYEPMTLEAGRTLALRYRVIVHSGRFNAERLRREYERFARKRVESSEEMRHEP